MSDIDDIDETDDETFYFNVCDVISLAAADSAMLIRQPEGYWCPEGHPNYRVSDSNVERFWLAGVVDPVLEVSTEARRGRDEDGDCIERSRETLEEVSAVRTNARGRSFLHEPGVAAAGAKMIATMAANLRRLH